MLTDTFGIQWMINCEAIAQVAVWAGADHVRSLPSVWLLRAICGLLLYNYIKANTLKSEETTSVQSNEAPKGAIGFGPLVCVSSNGELLPADNYLNLPFARWRPRTIGSIITKHA